jgi:hypothetical protein
MANLSVYIPRELLPVLDAVQMANKLPSRSSAIRFLLEAVAPAVGMPAQAAAAKRPEPKQDRRHVIDTRLIPTAFRREFVAWREHRIDRPSDSALLAALGSHPLPLLEEFFGPIPEPQLEPEGRNWRLARFKRLCDMFHEVRWWCCDKTPIREDLWPELRLVARRDELEALGVPA